MTFNLRNLVTPLILISILTFTGCSKPNNKILLSGKVESTQIDVNSEISGKVIKIEKDEGDVLKKDESLIIIDPSTQQLSVKQQESIVKLKKAKLDELRSGTRTEQIKQAEANFNTANTTVNAAKIAIDNAQVSLNYWLDKYNRLRALYDEKSVSENDMLDAKYKYDTAKEQLNTVKKQLEYSESQLLASKAQLELLQNGSTTQSIIAAQADLEQSEILLAQSKLILSKHTLKTPIAGTLLMRSVDIGDIVNTGTNVATISYLNNLWVSVYIPQKDLKNVSINQELSLTSSSLPNKTIKGKIIYISGEAEFTPKNTETTEAKENTVFKVKIKILNNIENLRPGMSIEALIPVKPQN